MRSRRVLQRILNGRHTYQDLGRLNSYEVALPQIAQSNTWSSTENNANNSWNTNFNDGNTNNNNKYNSNVVRPSAALDFSTKEGFEKAKAYSNACRYAVPEAFFTTITEAFRSCCAEKMTSPQCREYLIIASIDLPILAYEIWSDTYKPSVSTCFLVKYPKWREVFAANFRDRIVHHWICNHIDFLFERRFVEQGNVSFNCRVQFGTIKAVEAVRVGIKRVTNNYRREGWIYRGDLVGFFMSIDKDVMWRLLSKFIERKYHNQFKDIVLRLIKIVIYHRPERNCVFNTKAELWQNITENKSLLRNPPNKGMPIGNLTTQIFANFYMSFFDSYVQFLFRRENFAYARFVDDFIIICDSKKAILNRMDKMRDFLWRVLKVRLHHDKYYFQPTSHGVKFVGSYIKNGRMYLSNRTLARMEERIHGFNALIDSRELTTLDCARVNQVLNSYFGFCKDRRTYRRKRNLLSMLNPKFFKYFYIKGDCEYVKVRARYKPLKVKL